MAERPRAHLVSHLVAALVLVLGALVLHASERGRTITADESLHLVRGHAYWWDESARLSIAHPPLANAITSSPFAGEGDEAWDPLDPASKSKAEALRELSGWDKANPLPLSRAYFRHDFVAAKIELGLARHVMMAWTLVFAATIYLWCLARWGPPTALLALLGTLSFPTLLAHGQLVTTDLPATATTFWGLMVVVAWVERPRAWLVPLFALAASAMVLVKHSGPIYVLIFAAILLVCAWRGYAGFARWPSPRRRLAWTLAQLVFAALIVGFALALVYRFDRVGLTVGELMATPEPANWIARRREGNVFEASALRFLPDALPLPFPYTWLLGVATVGEQNELGHGRYFFGFYGRAWHPLYFPVMLLIKSPTGLLVLLGLGGGIVAKRRRLALASLSSATKVMLAFFVVSLTLACFSRINIGVRHALPLIPILVVFAARSGAHVWAAAPELLASLPARLRTRARARALVVACMAGNLVGAASTYPHWLGDFNLLCGGPWGGHFISIVGEDWGQDLGDTAEVLLARGETQVRYHTSFYLRSEELEHAGLTVTRLRCKTPYHGADPIVLHRTDWIRQRKRCFEWMGDAEPDLIVNHHVLIFLDAPPPLPDEVVEGTGGEDESDEDGE